MTTRATPNLLALPKRRRNRIINSLGGVNQRVFTSTTLGLFDLDTAFDMHRAYADTGSGTTDFTLARDTADVPTEAQAGVEIAASIKMTSNLNLSSPASTHEASIWTAVEGYNIADMFGGIAYIGFWYKSNVTGTHCVRFGNDDALRHYLHDFTVSVADTWEWHTIDLPLDDIASGGWSSTDGTGLTIIFTRYAGSSLVASVTEQWAAGNKLFSPNVTPSLSINDYWAVAGIRVEDEPLDTPHEVEPYVEELNKCMRYFQKSCEHGIAPFSPATLGRERWQLPTNKANTANLNVTYNLKQAMRDAPTVTVYSTTTGAVGFVRDDTTGSDQAVSVVNAGNFSYEITNQSGGTLTAGDTLNWQWTASAEM